MRSLLHVPAGAPDDLDTALACGPDAIVVDLVAIPDPVELAAARAGLADWLGTRPPVPVWVRINEGATGVADARAAVCPDVAGVCVVGAQSATELAALAVELAEAEERVGLRIGTVKLAPELGSPVAVLAAPQLAQAPRVSWLGLDEAQLCAVMGVEPGADERELLWVRSRVVVASAAAGIAAPVGAVCDEVDDLAALREHTLGLRRLGFRSRSCLHPAQVPVVHEVFDTDVAPVSPAIA